MTKPLPRLPNGERVPPGRWPCKSQPGGCRCQCHAVVAGMARSRRLRRDAWLPAHDDLIRERILAGDAMAAIAALLTERFGVRRTETALRRHVQAAELMGMGGYSRSQLVFGLGVSENRIRAFERDGLLGTAGPWRKWRRYAEDAVEAFVREYAGTLLDPRAVTIPKLRALAETSAIANRRRQSA